MTTRTVLRDASPLPPPLRPSRLRGENPFGTPGDMPVVGDWNSDGSDDIAVYSAGQFYYDSDGSGTYNAGDQTTLYGQSGDIAVAGTPPIRPYVLATMAAGQTARIEYEARIHPAVPSGTLTTRTLISGTAGSTAFTQPAWEDKVTVGSPPPTQQAAGDSIGRYAYTGREYDAEINLQYNRARYYDPATGRWISQDPLGFDAGDSNLYRYVHNRPTGATDPSGLVGAGIYPPDFIEKMKNPDYARGMAQSIGDSYLGTAALIGGALFFAEAGAIAGALANSKAAINTSVLISEAGKAAAPQLAKAALWSGGYAGTAEIWRGVEIKIWGKASPLTEWQAEAGRGATHWAVGMWTLSHQVAPQYQFKGAARKDLPATPPAGRTNPISPMRTYPGWRQPSGQPVPSANSTNANLNPVRDALGNFNRLTQPITAGPVNGGPGANGGGAFNPPRTNSTDGGTLGSWMSGMSRGQYPFAPNTARTAAPVTDEEIINAIRSVPTHFAPRMTQWGWTGSPSWRAAVREVARGGEGGVLRTVQGHVPTYEEAVELITAARGTIVRAEGPHAAGGVAGHIDFPHINFTTESGVRSHLAIQSLPSGL